MARTAIRRPRSVLAGWLAAMAVLAAFGVHAQDHLTQPNLVARGTQSEQALDVVRERFGPSTSVLLLLEGDRGAVQEQGRLLVSRLRASGISVLSPFASTTPPALRPRGGHALIAVSAPSPGREAERPDADAAAAKRVRDIAGSVLTGAVRFRVTGSAEILAQLKTASFDAAAQGEIVAVPILFLVLLLVFRTPIAALIPALFGGFTVLAGTGVLRLLTEVTDLTVFAATLTSMMGLALGVDYSLLMVSRYREERSAGAGPPDAALIASRTAGRTIVFAGIALGVAMVASVLLTHGDFLVSPALGVLVAGAISVAGGLIAIPAVLVLADGVLERWRVGGPLKAGGGAAAVARSAVRRPGLLGAAGCAVVIALSLPVFGMDTGPAAVGQLPDSSQAKRDFATLSADAGPGWAAPFEIVTTSPGGRLDEAHVSAFGAWAASTARDRGIATVLAPPRLSEDGSAARVLLIPATGPTDEATADLRDRLGASAARLGARIGKPVLVGGVAAELAQFDEDTQKQLPTLVLGLALVTFLVLTVLLRAPLLALVSVLLNLMTVTVAFGVLSALFVGSDPPLGGSGYLEIVTVVSMLTVIFGLSIDYQVFLLVRMREGLEEAGDPRRAILWGLDRTARVVTGAAAIMVGVFSAFATTDVATVRQFGIGLAVAITVDATVVRLVLLPAAMRLGGRFTWALPGPLERLLPRVDV